MGKSRVRWTSVDPWLAESIHEISAETGVTMADLTDIAFAKLVSQYDAAKRQGGTFMEMEQKTAKVIVVGAVKGGVGKTTSAENIAFHLQKRGNTVCLIDVDSQGDLSKDFGYAEDIKSKKGLTDYIRLLGQNIEDQEEPASAEPFCRVTSFKRISILSGDTRTSNIYKTIDNAVNPIDQKKINLYQVMLDQIKKLGKFDYIVIDTQPSMSESMYMLYSACDYLIVPTETTMRSIEAVQNAYELVQNIRRGYDSNLQLVGVFFTKVDSRLAVSHVNIPAAKEGFGDALFNTSIHLDAKIGRSENEHFVASERFPSSAATKDYAALTEEVVSRIG